MKKTRKVATAGALTSAVLLTAFLAVGSPLQAQDVDQSALNSVYQEELQAKAMYEQMVEKFDNDAYYERFIKAESKHADSVKRLIEQNGAGVQENSVVMNVSGDEITALKAAYDFEVKDVNDLTARIESAQNDTEKALYERLKDRSQRHVDSLQKAITAYEQGNTNLAQSVVGDRGKNSEGKGHHAQGQQMNGQGKQNCSGDCTGAGRQGRAGMGMRDGSGVCQNPDGPRQTRNA